jgi:hypothetical protein
MDHRDFVNGKLSSDTFLAEHEICSTRRGLLLPRGDSSGASGGPRTMTGSRRMPTSRPSLVSSESPRCNLSWWTRASRVGVSSDRSQSRNTRFQRIAVKACPCHPIPCVAEMCRTHMTLTRSPFASGCPMAVSARNDCPRIAHIAGTANSSGTCRTCTAFSRLHSARSGVTASEQTRTIAVSISETFRLNVPSRGAVTLRNPKTISAKLPARSDYQSRRFMTIYPIRWI